MQVLLAIIDRLSRLAETAAVALIFGYCALMLTEIVARAQAQSFSFTWEFSQYAMAAIFALGAGPALRSATHVRITLLHTALPERGIRWLDIAATLIALAIVAAMLQAFGLRVMTSYMRETAASSVLRTPLWIPQMLVLWGLAQLWLDILARLIRRVTNQPYEWRDSNTEAPDV